MDRKWTKEDHDKASYWDKFKLLSIEEIACLWGAVWPDEYIGTSPANQANINAFTNVPLALCLLNDALDANRLQCQVKPHYFIDNFMQGECHHNDAEGRKCKYDRNQVIEYATQCDHFPLHLFPDRRPKIIDDDEGIHHSPTTPAYLDKKHEYFAPELEAAIRVWNALFVEGGYKSNKGVKDQIKAWLDEHHQFSKEAKERISIVCNPNKTGGAPVIEK